MHHRWGHLGPLKRILEIYEKASSQLESNYKQSGDDIGEVQLGRHDNIVAGEDSSHFPMPESNLKGGVDAAGGPQLPREQSRGIKFIYNQQNGLQKLAVHQSEIGKHCEYFPQLRRLS